MLAIDQEVAARERLISHEPRDWLDLEFVAQSYMKRARLTGDYRDYQRAEDALNRAFQRAPNGSGPLLTRASFNYSVHRLARVEPDLVTIEHWAIVNAEQHAAIDSLRADVAYHAGHYPEALAGYEHELTRGRSVGALVSMAQYRWKTGDFDGASTLLDEAEHTAGDRDHGSLSWLSLVRGLMELDRGRYDAAIHSFRRGEELHPNDWLLQEHEAEALTLSGRGDLALPIYYDVIRRTDNPEYMTAVAEILMARGDAAAARPWIERARRGHDARVALFPEAAAGHALDHYLRFDPATAVPLAERNRDARPGGEAQSKLIRAYLRVGRFADARRIAEATLATPWNTAELHAGASLAFEHTGDAARAAQERARARWRSTRTFSTPHRLAAGALGRAWSPGHLRGCPREKYAGDGRAACVRRTPWWAGVTAGPGRSSRRGRYSTSGRDPRSGIRRDDWSSGRHGAHGRAGPSRHGQGALSPKPCASSRSASIPCSTSQRCTLSARRRDSSRLRSSLPASSV